MTERMLHQPQKTRVALFPKNQPSQAAILFSAMCQTATPHASTAAGTTNLRRIYAGC